MEATVNAAIEVYIAHHCEAMRLGLAVMLESIGGCRVGCSTASGAELLAACATAGNGALALVDLELTGMDAHVVLAALRDRHAQVRCLGITAQADPAVAERALLLDAAGVLPTTVDAQELEQALRQAHAGGFVRNAITTTCLRQRHQPARDRVAEAKRKLARLTGRELQVLQLMCTERLSAPAIGRRLGITENTVESHQRKLREKTGERDQVGLYHFALLSGLVKL